MRRPVRVKAVFLLSSCGFLVFDADVKRAPQIAFVSTKITQIGAATFDLEGDFTIRGVTKKEQLMLQDICRGELPPKVSKTTSTLFTRFSKSSF
jgi:polyisoprenoid-binding protein YceI